MRSAQNFPEMLAFSKYEGTGNDFIVVELEAQAQLPRALVARICERHFGIGADGVLLVLPPRATDAARTAARMRVMNADGSVPEMCGNGLRCVALHVARSAAAAEYAGPAAPSGAFARSAEWVFETDAGPRTCLVELASDLQSAEVTINMGAVQAFGSRTLEVDGVSYEPAILGVGNPHAVMLGAYSVEVARALGPRVATHASFPEGTNVGFARIEGAGIDLVVWERGVGLTLACGTGACAAARAAWDRGLLPRAPTEVRLPGGTLQVAPAEHDAVTMRGPARLVFQGTVQVPR
jgi:diaminopimelate epimerase